MIPKIRCSCGNELLSPRNQIDSINVCSKCGMVYRIVPNIRKYKNMEAWENALKREMVARIKNEKDNNHS